MKRHGGLGSGVLEVGAGQALQAEEDSGGGCWWKVQRPHLPEMPGWRILGVLCLVIA